MGGAMGKSVSDESKPIVTLIEIMPTKNKLILKSQ